MKATHFVPALVTLLAACSGPEKPPGLTQRDVKIVQHEGRKHPGKIMLDVRALVSSWLHYKMATPRSPKLDVQRDAIGTKLREVVAKHEDEIVEVLLRSKSETQRQDAARGLGFAKTPRAMEVLLAIVEGGTESQEMLVQSVQSLGLMAMPATPLEPFVALLDPEAKRGEGVRVAAALALMRIANQGGGTPEIGRRLLPSLKDESLAVRSQVAIAVATPAMRTAATGAALVPLLDDEKPRVRAASARSIGRVGYRPAAPRLVEMLRSPNAAVRMEARHALRSMFGRDMGADAKAWGDLVKSEIGAS